MPRRKPNIGRNTSNAKRMRLYRMNLLQNETPQERESRKAKDRERVALQRERESSDERNYRLSADRDRHKSRRERESSIERKKRLDADRNRQKSRRERESSIERYNRLFAARNRRKFRKERESSVEKNNRLTADKVKYVKRKRETQLEIKEEIIEQIFVNCGPTLTVVDSEEEDTEKEIEEEAVLPQ